MAAHSPELAVLPEQRRVSMRAGDREAEKEGEGSALHAGEAIADSRADEGRSTWSHAVKEQWPDETVRLLENWAAWVANDRKSISPISPYPAYRLSGRGKRDGNIIPMFSIEAEKADRIISAMVPRYQQPLRLHYGWKETTRSVRNKALCCNCAIGTYYTRLDEAHNLFAREWYQRVICNSLKSSV
jgi:hypothetical protein